MQIILHIGQQKTASTTIQAYLAQNRKKLAAQRVLYPKALGQKKAAFLGNIISNDERLGAPTREKMLLALRSEISDDYDRLLISNENLFNSPFQERLRSLLEPHATSWRVVCYVRRPDEHMVSNYQQLVKGPHVFTFDRFFELYTENGYYEYGKLIDGWAGVFGREAIEVRVFHRKTLQGSPVEDFAQWVGLDTNTLSVDPAEHVNESLDRVNTELLRLLRLGLVERPELMQRHEVGRITGRLRSLDTGERVRLDTTRAKYLQERFRADHELLAERYLSPEHAAVLLAPPAEVPPYPPLDRDDLARRIMRLFNDPDLVHFALESAEQPSKRDTIPRALIAPPREEVAARTLRSFRYGKALDRIVSLLPALSALVRRK